MKKNKTATSLLFPMVLAGCAAQSAYDRGQNLLDTGNAVDGLKEIKLATKLAPHDASYKQKLIMARDQSTDDLLRAAVDALGKNNTQQASELVSRAQSIDPANERAASLTRLISSRARNNERIKQATLAFEKGDIDLANEAVRAVLMEEPKHPEGLRLRDKIAAIAPENAAEIAIGRAYKRPISIEFRDVPLKAVLEVISRTSGLNFILDKDIKGEQKATIFLKNSSIKAALEALCVTNQLDQRIINENTVLIFPNTAEKRKDYLPLSVKSFFLANAEAKNVAAAIKATLQTRDIYIDEKLNMLLMRDSKEALRLAEKIVALQDRAEPEVMLELEVLEVSRSKLSNMGIAWPNTLTFAPLQSTTGPITLDALQRLNSTTIGVTPPSFTVNAKQEISDANILANPRIRVRNREKAKILIGNRVPNITSTSTATGFVAESVNYVDVGLKLEVEPTIYLDSEVAIKVGLEVSSIVDKITTQSGTQAYQIGTRDTSTILRLKDGENQVLAGLINDEERAGNVGIPGLASVPLLGRLFGNHTGDRSKSEIVLSITPHLVRNIERPDARAAEFEAGTEANLRGGTSSFGTSSKQDTPDVRTAVAPRITTSDPIKPSSSPIADVQGNLIGTVSSTSPTQVNGQSVAEPVPNVENVEKSEAVRPNNPASDAPLSTSGTLSMIGPKSVKIREFFNITLALQADQPIASVPFSVRYDPIAVEAVNVGDGGLLAQNNGKSTFNSKILAKSGQILATSTRNTEGGAPGPGTLATLTFRALNGATNTQISVDSISPIGVGGTAIDVAPPQPLDIQIIHQ